MRVALLLVCVLPGCDRLLPYRSEADRFSLDLRGDSPRNADLLALDGRRDSARPDTSEPAWRTIAELPQPVTGCTKPWVFVPEAAGCCSPLYKCGQTNASARLFPATAPYAQIRGRLRGRQYNSTDGFSTWFVDNGLATLDDAYVEGVSICVKSAAGVRQHVWTFAVGLIKVGDGGACPCSGGVPPPAFVGNAWTCESGNPGPGWDSVWYPPALWGDGAWVAGCKKPTPGAPWSFEVTLPQPTADPVEVRILYDDCDENVAITELKIEVR
jgi:hypothetical protein